MSFLLIPPDFFTVEAHNLPFFNTSLHFFQLSALLNASIPQGVKLSPCRCIFPSAYPRLPCLGVYSFSDPCSSRLCFSLQLSGIFLWDDIASISRGLIYPHCPSEEEKTVPSICLPVPPLTCFPVFDRVLPPVPSVYSRPTKPGIRVVFCLLPLLIR